MNKSDQYLIMNSTTPMYTCGIESALKTAKELAKQHPRHTFKVYKFVAEVKSEVREPDVVMANTET